MSNKSEIEQLLNCINPTYLEYNEWVSVGMALKDEGIPVQIWDEWSSRDSNRYVPGECQKKWNSFVGSNSPVTIGTLVHLAEEQGTLPTKHDSYVALDWDAEISRDDELKVVDTNWLQSVDVVEPGEDWQPHRDLIKYLETLFSAEENVGYVTESWEKEDKFLPKKGNWDRTAGQLIAELNSCNGDIGAVFGDCRHEVGAWIRFNPLDGKGCRDENVTDFRFTLIESDNMEIDKQHALLKELELPIACLVHSGGKSLHAIVRVDATGYEEYRKRVDFLHDVCKRNGLLLDKQNRNPSRLSRMPGVMRNGHKQFLLATNIGKSNWAEWREWIEGINDDLPEPEALNSIWDNLPSLADELISNVLRQGHKMLVAGPSKAGKSFFLIELCIAIAEGRKWCGWNCAKGQVLYVNLELDRASCLHRFANLYKTLGWEPKNINNIDIWNLRGKAVPLDKLAPKLIRRAMKKKYIAVILDPIYKIITGDENSADQMAFFTNQFDKICTELGSSVIYCHHHSKGYQGSKKSMDRASGSGVFARDPDALLDLIELYIPESLKEREKNNALRAICEQYFPEDRYITDESKFDTYSYIKKTHEALSGKVRDEFNLALIAAERIAYSKSAWRIDGTLREFPKFHSVNVWFDYPMHATDSLGILADLEPLTDMSELKDKNKKKLEERKEKQKAKQESQKETEIMNAYEACKMLDGKCSVKDIAEYFSKSERTVREWVSKHPNLKLFQGLIVPK